MMNKGFTLVEILATVVILGIIAAIAIPQFTPTTTQANTSVVSSDLQAIRMAIEYYKIQHSDANPGTMVGVSFVQAMTQKTDPDGTLNPAGIRGPYIQRVPTNPFNALSTVEEDGVLGGGDNGWHYDTTTGEFHADTDGQTGL